MTKLNIRENVKGYVRNTYLGSSDVEYNKKYSLIDCSIGESQWGVSQKAIKIHAKQDIQIQAKALEKIRKHTDLKKVQDYY